jgi:predicted DNA-binding transcriptional regulator AlpA
MKFLRYRDLKAMGVVSNKTTLRRWILTQGFPPGKKLGPKVRAWLETEVEAWLATRPGA